MDMYEVLHDDTVVFTREVGDYASTTLKEIIAYAIGYASCGAPVTVRRVENGKLIFAFDMTNVAWRPYENPRPVEYTS